MRFLFLTALLVSSCIPTRTSPTAGYVDKAQGIIEIGDVDDRSMAYVLGKVQERVAAGDRVVMLRIDSFGGSVFAGLDFIKNMDEVRKRGVRVECVVDSKAMSMGFVILQSVCDRRLMTRRSVLLAHEAASKIEGNATELESEAAFLRALSKALAGVCADRMGMTLADFEARIAGRDWVMASDEALAVHAVDGLVNALDLPPAFD